MCNGICQEKAQILFCSRFGLYLELYSVLILTWSVYFSVSSKLDWCSSPHLLLHPA